MDCGVLDCTLFSLPDGATRFFESGLRIAHISGRIATTVSEELLSSGV